MACFLLIIQWNPQIKDTGTNRTLGEVINFGASQAFYVHCTCGVVYRVYESQKNHYIILKVPLFPVLTTSILVGGN